MESAKSGRLSMESSDQTAFRKPEPASSATGLYSTEIGEPKLDRVKTGSLLKRTAAKVSDLTHSAVGATRWGNRAGGSIDRAATYLRNHSVDEITQDVQGWLRQKPERAIFCAAAVGFVAGVTLRRR